MIPFCFIHVLQSIPTFLALGFDIIDQVYLIKITVTLTSFGIKMFWFLFVCVFKCMRESPYSRSQTSWGLKM